MSPESAQTTLPRQRVRQLLPNLHLGFFPPGLLNAITDVPGVLVSTLSIHDDGTPSDESAGRSTHTHTHGKPQSQSAINTGVTCILPRASWFDRACYAAIHSFNGSGELTGSHWINETGLLNSPIVLTNSFAVGAGYEGVYRYAVKSWREKNGHGCRKPVDWFLLPVVGETYDGFLNDIGQMPVRSEHVVRAIEMAAASGSSDQPVHLAVSTGDAGGSSGGGGGIVSSAAPADSAGDEAAVSPQVTVQTKHDDSSAAEWHGNPIREGNTGGGTGMLTTGFKGGTGTSSRIVPGIVHGRHTEFVVGALVQSNFGKLEDLHFGSVPVGRAWVKEFGNDGLIVPGDDDEKDKEAKEAKKQEIPKEGSIIAIVATNAPLHPLQLRRLAQRATVGLSRVGGFGANSSGDIFLAFSTADANAVRREPATDPAMSTWEARRAARVEREQEIQVVQDTTINGLFEAAAEVVNEAVLNALCMAEEMVGVGGNRAEAIPLEWLRGVVGRYEAAGGV